MDPMVITALPGRALGRVKPIENYDYGDFKAVKTSDGVTRFFPRIRQRFDKMKMGAAPATGPLGRGTNAAQIIKQMYRNNVLSCCVISSRKHKIGILNINESGTNVIAADAEVDKDYHAACGAGDNGCNMATVNDYERTTGMLMNGVRHPIEGSVSVDHTDQTLVKVMLTIFGTLNVGMDLPNAWYQSPEGADWGPTNTPIVGGHEVQAYDYDSSGVWILTWGGTRRILWTAFQAKTWIDECYSSLAKDWYQKGNLAPNGIDVTALRNDLSIANGGQTPPLPDGPTPPPNPVHTCPTGQHWDDALQSCVPDAPTPTPTTLHGFTDPFTITIPGQGVFGHAQKISVPAIPVTVSSDGRRLPEPNKGSAFSDMIAVIKKFFQSL